MPEKTASEVSRELREYFVKGSQAFQRDNFDYAISIFNTVLEKEPGFLECRQHLRVAQYKKKEKGAVGGFFKKVFSTAGSSQLLAKGQLALRRNPAETLTIAEQVLNNDPANGTAHRMLAEAALALDLPRTAMLSLEIVLKNNPGDKNLRIKLAEAVKRAGDIERAEKIYSDLLREHPNDSDIAMALKNISANKTLSEKGYDTVAKGEGSYRDLLKDQEQTAALEQEQRQVHSKEDAGKLIHDLEKRLQAEPDNVRLMRSLAELHVQKQEFDKALKLYDRIKTKGGLDPELEKAIGEVSVRKFERQVAELDPDAPDYASQLEQLKADKLAFRIEECRARAEKYPTDMAIRFDLGKLLFEAGRISDAIKEFQKAQTNPNKRTQSQYYLGQCFAKRGMLDLAARTLQSAISEKQALDEEKKELIYSLALVLEKMGKPEEAIEQYKLIYEVDSGYKDVEAKVDAYYADK